MDGALMDWPPTDREMLIRIDENVKYLKEGHETYVKKVDKIGEDYVSKAGLAGWFTVAFLGLAGLGEMLGVYRKG